MKLLKKGLISDDLISGTGSSDVDIFDHSRFNGYAKGNSG
jgi:hypothetical protein